MILGADQKERGLWGRECACTSVVACDYNVFVFLKNVFLVGIIKFIFAMIAVVI